MSYAIIKPLLMAGLLSSQTVLALSMTMSPLSDLSIAEAHITIAETFLEILWKLLTVQALLW